MKPKDQIKAIAELDGRYVDGITTDGDCYETIPQRGSPDDDIEVFRYLTSRDAIVPVIEKQGWEMIAYIMLELFNKERNPDLRYSCLATPSQLCEALLRATGKWVD
jgi:hypothetical protein